MRNFCLAVLVLLVSPFVVAQDHDHGAMGAPASASAPTVPSEVVSFPSGGETVHGRLYLNPGKGKHPALIVIHDWMGLDNWAQTQASEYVAKGYTVLAADLYRGQVAADANMAHELSRGLPQDQGIRDLVGAFNYLAARKDVKAEKIGVIGWCMGGGYALQLAIAEPRLAAVVVNYGSLPTDKDVLNKIHAKLLGNFGGLDKGIPPAAVSAFAANMEALGKPVDVKDYPNSGHGFMKKIDTRGYNATDTIDAQARIDAFFAKTLQ